MYVQMKCHLKVLITVLVPSTNYGPQCPATQTKHPGFQKNTGLVDRANRESLSDMEVKVANDERKK